MKKTIYTLFLLLLSVVCLTSCGQTYTVSAEIFESNAFRLVRQVSNDQKICMQYIFPVNSNELKDLGYTESQILTYKFYLSSYVNTLAQNNRSKITTGTQVGSSQYFSDIDGVGFSIIFDDLESQNRFFGVQDETQSLKKNNYRSSGLLMKRTEMKTTFPFSKNSAGDLKMLVLMAMSSWANDQNLSDAQKKEVQNILNDSLFIYDFATTQTSLKSQIMYDDENFHHNVFIKNHDQLETSAEIVFYTESPNYPVWYFSALLIVVLGMLIAFFVIKTKNKSNKFYK